MESIHQPITYTTEENDLLTLESVFLLFHFCQLFCYYHQRCDKVMYDWLLHFSRAGTSVDSEGHCCEDIPGVRSMGPDLSKCIHFEDLISQDQGLPSTQRGSVARISPLLLVHHIFCIRSWNRPRVGHPFCLVFWMGKASCIDNFPNITNYMLLIADISME